jgi:hypothetical protein
MSDHGPCNCDQALELTRALTGLCEAVEETDERHLYWLRDVAVKARETLKKWEKKDGRT